MIVHPFDEVLAQANELIAAGSDVYQQFNCGACAQKLTIDVPNTFYTTGKCDACGALTDLKEAGCNMMVVTSLK